MARSNRPSLPRLLLYAAATIIVLLGVAQLVLPRVAESRIRSRLERYGNVHSVHVSAWPAIELLWGNADSAKVQAGALALSASRAASLLHEAKGISNVTFAATAVRLGKLRLTAASLRKHGDRLSAAGLVSGTDVRAALPPGVALRLLGSEAGKVMVRASGTLFGFGASLDTVAEPSSGRIVVRPMAPMFGTLQLTFYENPRIYVLGVSARALGTTPPTYRVGLTALLR
jgi:hypothetical protein